MGPGEAAFLSLTGGDAGSLSRICSGTRSWREMCGGGTWCLLQGLRGDDRLCRKKNKNAFEVKYGFANNNKDLIQ